MPIFLLQINFVFSWVFFGVWESGVAIDCLAAKIIRVTFPAGSTCQHYLLPRFARRTPEEQQTGEEKLDKRRYYIIYEPNGFYRLEIVISINVVAVGGLDSSKYLHSDDGINKEQQNNQHRHIGQRLE